MLGQYLGAGSTITKGLWHFEGNSNDSSGNTNNGTDTDITYGLAYGKFGQGALFNGASSKIALSKNSTTYLYNDWTMAVWAKRGSTTSGTDGIYQMGNCVLGFGFASYYDGSAGRLVVDSSVPTDTTNWYFYVWTKSSSSGQKLYRNGVLVGTQASTSNNSDSYSKVNIGRFDSPGNSWFNGTLDEFILEGRIWSASDIKKYYTYAKGRFGLL